MQRLVVSLLAAASLFLACGSTTTNGKYDQTQTAVTPTGSITVRVLDGATYQPLQDVAITVVGTSTSLTTDANGLATFTGAVVNSSYIFVASKGGYLNQTSGQMSINGTSGNSPLAGSVTTFGMTLYKADATIKGFVFLPNGTPAKNATVYVDERSAGDAVATAQTGADGSFSLSNIASRPTGFSYSLFALYYDENGDGLADYPSTSVNVTALPGQTSRVFITYPNNIGQRIVASNVLDGSLLPSTDLSFQFALPVQNTNFNGQAANAFVLTDLSRNNATVAVTATWSNDTTVAIHPVSALSVGDRYSIAISVTNASTSSNAAPNFTPNPIQFQVRPDGATAITSQVTNLSAQNASPINTSAAALNQYDYNANSFKLQWDSVTGAVNYSVYAKDTKQNPDWVLVGTYTASGASRQVTTVSLGYSFDMLPNTCSIIFSNCVEPLAGGNAVTFTVVPMDIYGSISPLATSPTVTVSDNLQPSWVGTLQRLTASPIYNTVDAINDDSVPAQWLFRLVSTEPMDPSSPPVFTGNGSPTQAWTWDATTNAFTLVLTIPPGGDASGNFLVRGGKDVAGNVVINGDIQSSLWGYKDILPHGTFEDATGCSIAGWNATTTVSMPAAQAVLATGVSQSRCSAVFGAPNGTPAATGISRLAQDISIASVPTGSGWYYTGHISARGVTQSGGTAGYQSCRLTQTDGSETPISTMYGSTTANSAGNTIVVNTPFTVPTPAATVTQRVICEVNNTSATPTASNTTLYVDDLSIVLVKPGTL